MKPSRTALFSLLAVGGLFALSGTRTAQGAPAIVGGYAPPPPDQPQGEGPNPDTPKDDPDSGRVWRMVSTPAAGGGDHTITVLRVAPQATGSVFAKVWETVVPKPVVGGPPSSTGNNFAGPYKGRVLCHATAWRLEFRDGEMLSATNAADPPCVNGTLDLNDAMPRRALANLPEKPTDQPWGQQGRDITLRWTASRGCYCGPDKDPADWRRAVLLGEVKYQGGGNVDAHNYGETRICDVNVLVDVRWEFLA